MPPKIPGLYKQHFVDKHNERLGLFQQLAVNFRIKSALYPGSFVHVTPAFVFPNTSFVDSDKRTPGFFSDPALLEYVSHRKSYTKEPKVRFLHENYESELPLERESFDLLISQYAGFISQACKEYLSPGGILVANNSHGDASVASIDNEYEFIAAINRRGEKFTLTSQNLGSYFLPAKQLEITEAYLKAIQRGIGYRKRAFAYVFRKRE